MKLYGFTKMLSFYCICYGTKAFFFGMAWGRKDKRLHFYKGHATAKEIIFHRQNTYPKWWFFGFMIDNKEEVEETEETYYD